MERSLNGQRIHRHVVCATCGKESDRVQREDSSFGTCRHCGGRLAPRNLLENKRVAKAKADLARMDPDAARKESGKRTR